MASSVPGARTALYDGLTATFGGPTPALDGVGVFRTGLWKDVSARDRIIVGKADPVLRDIAALGTLTPFREEFTLFVYCEVYRRGDDIGFVEDRLWDLVTAVEQFLLADKTLGGNVSQALPGDVREDQSGPSGEDEDTVIARATLSVECRTNRVLLN
jgi:hypothetical protein